VHDKLSVYFSRIVVSGEPGMYFSITLFLDKPSIYFSITLFLGKTRFYFMILFSHMQQIATSVKVSFCCQAAKETINTLPLIIH
jgi:hypothetical protein